MEGIDWNELWRRGRLNYTWNKRHGYSADFWDGMWKRSSESVTRQTERIEWIISKLSVQPEDTILDIGSGSGALAIPLAKTAKCVTAIDISKFVLGCLEERAKKEGLSNIKCIGKKWEDIELGKDIEQHDIAFASYSLAMLDLREALSKMNKAVKRAVYIFEAAGKRFWHYQEIWPKLYGEEFVPSPDYIYIVNVLYQMGIYANVEASEYEAGQRFSTLDQAVEQWQRNLGDATPETSEIIRDYLSKTLKKEEDGLWSKRAQKMVAIWWSKE